MKVALIILALIAAALTANTLIVDLRTRPAMARTGGRIVETPVVAANVAEAGNGPAIVMIHGFGAAIDWWDEIAPALATDHRVIRVDLIGHGGTAAPARATRSRGRRSSSPLCSTGSASTASP